MWAIYKQYEATWLQTHTIFLVHCTIVQCYMYAGEEMWFSFISDIDMDIDVVG